MSSLHCPISLKLRICASVVEIWSLLQKNKITKNRAEWDKIRVQTLEIKQTEREPGEGGDGGGGGRREDSPLGRPSLQQGKHPQRLQAAVLVTWEGAWHTPLLAKGELSQSYKIPSGGLKLVCLLILTLKLSTLQTSEGNCI